MDPSEKPNGAQKRARSASGPHYRECLRNHAASLGTHALDGCGEFFPSPPPSSPLTCSACGCHRNFHRKVAGRDPGGGGDDDGEDSADEAGSHVLLTLKTGAAAAAGPAPAAGPARRKRFRSRFTREQKEGMMELAERLGWRLQRREEGLVEHGCRTIGVERGVFKVWMHNNKQSVLETKRRRSGDAHSHRQGESNGGDVDRKVNGDHNGPGSPSSSPSSHPL